jgi:DNA-binding transcriptional LysR family regulator
VDIDEAIEKLTADHGQVTGLLRISAVGVVLEMALTPILTTLAQLHPRLTVEVHADQTLVDIVAEGYDAGIRLRRAIQQDMVTTRLTGSFKAILVDAEPLVRRYVRDGSLKWLLPQTAVEYDGLFLYYPRRASLAPKLRAFIDVAKQTLKSIA